MYRNHLIQIHSRIRTIINALMIAALLAGLLTPPALTHLMRNIAPESFDPISGVAVALAEAAEAPTIALAAPDEGTPSTFSERIGSGWQGLSGGSLGQQF